MSNPPLNTSPDAKVEGMEEVCESIEAAALKTQCAAAPVDKTNSSRKASSSVDERLGSEGGLTDHLAKLFHAPDNKLGIKLFGGENLLLKEQLRQKDRRRWIIHPLSNFRLIWDVIMIVTLCANLVAVPVIVAYFYNEKGTGILTFNIISDVIFFMDIIVNFRTGIMSSKSSRKVTLNPRVIAQRYLKTWFAIDLLSTLPLDYLYLVLWEPLAPAETERLIRLVKILQLLRILNISRLVRYINIWLENYEVGNAVVKILQAVFFLIFVGHWSGCIQFLVPVLQGYPADSFIILDKSKDLPWFEQYTRSLVKAISHMFSCGYGINSPMSQADNWTSLFSIGLGCCSYALFVGYTMTLLQAIDTSGQQFKDHLQTVIQYMKNRRIPGKVRNKVADYYEHRYNGKLFDENEILSEISDTLRRDVIRHNCKDLIRNVPLFVSADPRFVNYVISKLEFELFQPGDVIIEVNTSGERMFFIQEGFVEIIAEDGSVVTHLSDGSFFGEISLLTQGPTTATAVAASYCHLYSLSKAYFNKVLENYPEIRPVLQAITVQRLIVLGKDTSMFETEENTEEIRAKLEENLMESDSYEVEEVKINKGQLQAAFERFSEFFTKDNDVHDEEVSKPKTKSSAMIRSKSAYALRTPFDL